MKPKETTPWPRKNSLQMSSLMINLNLTLWTRKLECDSLKEILESTNVKPRMIRWTLLLQEFELQIMQRKEKPPEVPNSFEEILAQERVSSIYIHPGTILPEKKFSNTFCNGFSNFFRPTIHKGKKKKMQKLMGSKFPKLIS
jgi:hypothetical protein